MARNASARVRAARRCHRRSAGCGGQGGRGRRRPQAQLAALRARTDSLRKAHGQMAAAADAAPRRPTATVADVARRSPATPAPAAVGDSGRCRPTRSIGGRSGHGRLGAAGAGDRGAARDVRLRAAARAIPFASLINSASDGPRARRSRARRRLPGPAQRRPTASSCCGRRSSGKRHKMRVGDQLGRPAGGADPRPRCRVHDCRTSGSSARKLSRCASRRSRRHDAHVSLDARRRRGSFGRGSRCPGRRARGAER